MARHELKEIKSKTCSLKKSMTKSKLEESEILSLKINSLSDVTFVLIITFTLFFTLIYIKIYLNSLNLIPSVILFPIYSGMVE